MRRASFEHKLGHTHYECVVGTHFAHTQKAESARIPIYGRASVALKTAEQQMGAETVHTIACAVCIDEKHQGN